ncbi:MAG: PHP domain-containing protein [Candidatus Hadarchaeota archaeon]
MKVDLHVHTIHSSDGYCTVAEAVKFAKAKGLDGIAIADHNTIAGHREAKKLSGKGFIIIPAAEISSSSGHIVALGIKELVPRGLSTAETVKRIKEQGGVAIAAHPFIIGRNPSLMYKAKFDAMEVLNGRAVFPANRLARGFAEKHGIPGVGGSDAHRGDEIGLAYTEIDCEKNIASILSGIRKGGPSASGRTLPLPSLLWRFLQRFLHHHSRRRRER